MSKEMVNHPSHYTRENGMECIDEMLLLFGVEEVKSFCKLNAWKYRYRAADKNGEEDLKKSDWYIQKYKELSEPVKTTISSYGKVIADPYGEIITNPYSSISISPCQQMVLD